MSKKLLLADDSITIQKVIGITFANEDYELAIVDNGDAALEKARSLRPDLILADVFMPGKNGYELCAAIKQDPLLQRTPVLLLSGTFEPFDEEKARDAGADSWIAKPFESQALIDRVEELLARVPPTASVPAEALAPAEAPESAVEVESASADVTSDLWDELEGFEEEVPAESLTPAAEATEAAEEEEPHSVEEDLWDSVSFDEEDLLEEPEPEPLEAESWEDVALEEGADDAFLSPATEEDEFFSPEEPVEDALVPDEGASPFAERQSSAEEPQIAAPPQTEPRSFPPEAEFEGFAFEEEDEEEILSLDESDILAEEDLLLEEEAVTAAGLTELEPEGVEAGGPAEEEPFAASFEESEETPLAGYAFDDEESFGEVLPTEETGPVEEEEEEPWLEAEEKPQPVFEPEAPRIEEALQMDSTSAPAETAASVDLPESSLAATVEERVGALSEEDLARIVEKVAGSVIERLADSILEKVAWEVVPDLAENMIRDELRRIKEGVHQ